MNVVARFFDYARPWRPVMIKATSWSILNKLFDIAPEILIGIAVDLVVKRDQSLLARYVAEPLHQLLILGGATLLIWVLESFFEYLMSVQWRGLAQSVQHSMRMDAWNQVQSQDLRWYEDQKSGNLVAILNDDVNQLERFLDTGASELIQLLTSTILVGGVFFYLSPMIGFLAMLPIPIVFLGSNYFQNKLQQRYTRVREASGALSGRLSANLRGLITIQSFTAEALERDNIARESTRYLEANRHAIALSSAFIPVIRMAILAGFLFTLVLGGQMALEGTLAVGAYSVLVFLTQRLLWPFTRLAQTLDQLERARASTRRILELIQTPIRILDRPGAKALSGCQGRVELDNVTFRYGEKPVLDQISMTLPPGTFIGLVGPTGAGKSTLVKLLMRFYDCSEGAIRVDGHDVRDLTLESLRRNVAYVSQEVFLFDASIEENIRYAVQGASLEQVRAAAQAAGAESFILELESGYQTRVGEGGVKLSGGQRQRISIARALLKNAPILVFDEATSAVDNETEAAIQESLERVRAGHTVIVIAHRLSTIRHADRIYVLEGGRIAQAGAHEALVQQPGLYQRLWSIQTGDVVRNAQGS